MLPPVHGPDNESLRPGSSGASISDGQLQDTQTINVKVADGVFEKGNSGVADNFVFKSHFGLEIVNGFDPASSSRDVIELDHSLFKGATVRRRSTEAGCWP